MHQKKIRSGMSLWIFVHQSVHSAVATLALLKELVDVSMAGDEEPIPTLARPWVAEAVAADPEGQIRIQVHAARQISERVGPVLQALRGAATADSEVAALWRPTASNRGLCNTM